MRVLSRLRARGPRSAGRRSDRGAVALFVAICAAYLVLVIALVIDAGGRLRVAERTDAYAQEAARVGGQQLDQAAVLQGKGFKVQQDYVRRAAEIYLERYGLQVDHITFSDDGKVVTVTVQADYRPVLLGALGERKVTGRGSATLVHGVEKAETD
ncbi:TadE/TadG family type IV pilus assembly protein [Streptomyces sp. CBMA123]|uniref:TadE/TadG family type IV pilus assembly protein n=1 Tax=Streptomyces sp. CBMA123 TaxID=1896313 RepID=UPI001661ADD8|nr:hypothetical protein [Streptomyces sp. CBMA123]MBD0692029.1 hypothetical protein [Streptomyces sp. CBMA123]